MVAVVSSNGLGLNLGSGSVLGGAGIGGAAAFGRQSDRVYVNAASGNLVVQTRDELLAGRGPDAAGLRTYNSLGAFTDDNGDNWQPGLIRKVWLAGGSPNAAGSTVLRRDEDGSEALFSWDAGRYINKDGSGAYDSLSYDGGSGNWTFVDGSSRVTEVYAGGTGRLLSATDADGQTLSFAYDGAGLLASVTTAAGEITYYDYSGNQLTQLRTVTRSSEGAGLDRTLTRVRYGYDASNRLSSVIVDLSPEDNSVADGRVFTTSYTYEGTSKRVASITQSDGAKLSFTYDASQRIQTVIDALGGITGFAYDSANRATTVTDALGQATTYRYDTANRLTQINSPTVNGVVSTTRYDYNATNGDVTQITDAENRAVVMDYDAWGNVIRQTDAATNVVRRGYNAQNQLIAETVATAGEPGNTAPSTRYVYDSTGTRLRFEISAEGRVSEYRYDNAGQRTSAIQYAGAQYGVSGSSWWYVPSETDLTNWANAQDRSKTQRVDYAYDWRGQLARSTSYDSVDAAGNGQGATPTLYVYDAAGQLLKTLDARNGASQVTYDGLGRTLTTTNALNQISVNSYDDAGGSVRTTAFNGLVTSSTFDRLGRAVSVVESGATPSARYVTSANMTLDGSTLSKTSGGDGWDSGAYSKQGIAGGASVSFRPAQNNKYLMVGLNTDPASNHSYTSIDWAMYCTAGGTLEIYENGAQIGSFGAYSAGDQLAVTYDGATVRYVRNGQVLRAVAAAISQPLYADTSFYNVGGKVGDLRFESNAIVITNSIPSANFVADNGVSIVGREVTKTGGVDSAWDSAFRSTVGYVGTACVSFRPAQADKQLLVGLNTDPSTNNSYDSLDWAFSLGPNGELFTVDRTDATHAIATQYGTYVAGDQLSVSYDARVIRYIKNGVVLHTVVTDIAQPLYADSSFYRAGGKITDLRFEPNATTSGNFATDGWLSFDGSSVTKTGGVDGTWDSSIRSTVGYVGGASVSFRPAQADKQINVGLNTDPTTNSSYNSLDWVFSLGPNGELFTLERIDATHQTVTQYGTYAAGDLLSVSYDGTAVRFIKNGVVLRSVAANITQPLYADSSFARVGGKITDLRFEPNATVGTFAADGGLTLDGRAATKTGGVDGLWDSAFRSTVGYVGGASVSFRPTQADKQIIIGLNTDPTTNTSYTSIDWGFSLGPNGELVAADRIDANNATYTSCGTFAPGDLLSVSYDGTAIRYIKNGVVLRSVTANITQPLYADSTFYRTGAQVTDLVFEGGPALSGVKSFYDADSRLRMTQDSLGARQWYLYDEADRLVGQVNALGQLTETVYNKAGQVTQTISYANLVNLTSLVDAGGQPTNVGLASVRPTGSAGDIKRWSAYDSAGRLTKTVTPLGEVTELTYDTNGHLLITRRYANTISTAGLGSAPAPSAIAPTTSGDDQILRSFYDNDGLLVGNLDASGSLSENQYDAAGRLVAQLQRIQFASATQVNQAISATTTLAQVRPADGSADHKALNFYNARGQLVGQLDGEGDFTETQYDASGNVSKKLGYSLKATGFNTASLLASIRSAAGSVQSQTIFEYDPLNRALKARVDPNGLNLTTTSVYDDANGQLYVTSPNNTTTRSQLDAKGRVIASTVDPSGLNLTTRTSYDAQGHVATVTDPKGSVTQYTYDSLGRVASQTADWGGLNLTTTYSYDVNGSLARVTDPKQQSTRYVYDRDNRLQYQLDAESGLTEYRYDALGQRIQSVRYAEKQTGIQTVNVGSGLISNSFASITPNVAKDQVSRNVYDAAGRQTYSVDGAGSVTQYEYDAAGQVLAKRELANQAPAGGALKIWHREGTNRSASRYLGTFKAGDVVTATVRFKAAGNSQGYLFLGNAGGSMDNIVETSAMGNDGWQTLTVSRTMTHDDSMWVYIYGDPSSTDNSHFVLYDNVRVASQLRGEVLTDSFNSVSYASDYLSTSDWWISGQADPVQLGLVETVGQAQLAAFLPTLLDPARDRTTRYVYDAAGRQTYGVDGAGSVKQYIYDAAGQVVTTRQLANQAPTGSVTQAQLTALLPTLLDAVRDRTTRYIYDAAGRVVYTQDPLGGVVKNRYDVRGLLVERIAYSHRVSTSLSATLAAFDTAVQAQADAAYDQRTRTVYDALGRARFSVALASGSLDRGVVTETVYDIVGRVARTLQYADYVAYSAVTDSATETSVRALLPASTINTRESLYTYDAVGRLVYTAQSQRAVSTQKYFTVIERRYDELGQLGEQIAYANAVVLSDLPTVVETAQIVSRMAIARDDVNDRHDRSTYDAVGRLLTTTDGEGYTERYVYDALGHKTQYTNKNGATTDYTYDAVGRVVQDLSAAVDVYSVDDTLAVSLSAGQRLATRYSYDAFGNLLSRTEAAGIADQERTTRYEYDALGRQVKTHFAAVAVYDNTLDSRSARGLSGDVVRAKTISGTRELVTQTIYDAFGQAVANVDVSGYYSYKTYDQLGRVVLEIDANHNISKHLYSDNVVGIAGQYSALQRIGMSASFTDGLGVSADTLTAAAQAAQNAAGQRSVYTYLDQLGRTIGTTDLAEGAYSFDAASGQSGVWTRATTYAYTVFGDLESKTLVLDRNGQTRPARDFYTYDLAGGLARTVDAEGGVTGYTRNAFGEAYQTIEYATKIDPGNPTAAVADLRASAGATSAIGFDRVTQNLYDRRGLLRSTTLAGTQLGQRSGTNTLGTQLANAQIRYQYDGAGNAVQILNRVLDGSGNALETGTETLNFYDALGHVVATTNGYGYGSDVRYDALGNAVQSTRHANVFAIAVNAPAAGQLYQRYSISSQPAADATNDQITTTRFDALGRAIQVRDALNSATSDADRYMNYDAAGHVVRQSQAFQDGEGWRNAVSFFGYDKVGQQTSTTTLTQRQRSDTLTYSIESAAYNSFGEITAKTLQERAGDGSLGTLYTTQQNWYDAGGRLWKTIAGGTTKIYWYDLQDHITAAFTSTAATNGRDLSTFNAPQDIASYASLGQGVSRATTTYDRAGRATAQTTSGATHGDAAVTTSSSQVLDRWGNTTSLTKNGVERLRYRYDSGNRVISEVHVANVVWSAIGTQATRDVEKRIFYDAWGHSIGNIDGENNANAAQYDSRGRLQYEYRADGGAVSYSYDGLDRQTGKIDEVLRQFIYAYDRADHEVSRSVTDTTGNHSLGSSSYDELGRKKSETTGQDAASWNQTRYYDYDARGLMWRSRDALGKSTLSWYDLGGRKKQETDANGLTTTWGYDQVTGLLTAHTDMGGATYSYSYNQLGQLKAQTSTRGQNLGYIFFEDGRIRQITENGAITVYDYDVNGNRTRDTFVGSDNYRDVTSTYDNQDRLTSAKDAATGTDFKIDSAVRYSVQIGYDAAGNRRRVWGQVESGDQNIGIPTASHPGLKDVDQWFTYDAMNRVLINAGKLVSGAVSDVDAVARYGYDAGGRQTQIITKSSVSGAGYLTSVGYDFANRLLTSRFTQLQGLTNTPGTTQNRLDRSLAYLNGQQIETNNDYNEYAGTSLYRTRVSTTNFNAQGRANTVVEQEQGQNGIGPDGNATHVTGLVSISNQTFSYDATGNIAQVSVDSYTPKAGAPGGYNQVKDTYKATTTTTTYSYYVMEGYRERSQVLNRTTFNESGGITQVQAPSVSGESYDASGKLVRLARTLSDGSVAYTWYVSDAAGHVVQRINNAYPGNNSNLTPEDVSLRQWNPVSSTATATTTATLSGMTAAPYPYDSNNYSSQANFFVNDQLFGTRTFRITSNNKVGQMPPSVVQTHKDWIVTLNAAGLDAQPINAGSGQVYTSHLGDTAGALAQRFYGDARLWYVIADANSLTGDANAGIADGWELKIPNISRSGNTSTSFAVYDAGKAIGSTAPEALAPPPPKDNGCGMFATFIVIVVAIVVTAITQGSTTSWFTEALGETGAAAADGAIAGAAGSAAGQVAGNVLGVQSGFNWGQIGLGAIGGAVGGGLKAAGILADSAAARAALASTLTQGAAVVTGLQDKFDWRSVAAAAIAAPIAQSLSDRFGGDIAKALDGAGGIGTRTAMSFITGVASQGVRMLVTRQGKVDYASIAADAFGNAIGESLAGQTQGQGPWSSKDYVNGSDVEDDIYVKRRDALYGLGGSGARFGDAGIALTDHAVNTFEPSFAESARRVAAAQGGDSRNALYRPGIDNPTFIQTHEVAGHFSEPLYVGQAYVGIYSPKLGRDFTQDDLNLMVAHSQFFDQIKDLDAKAAGVRYPLAVTLSLDSAPQERLIQQALHSLNDLGADGNRDRILDLIQQNPGNLELAGAAMHPYADAGPHENKDTFLGHAIESKTFRDPDPLTETTAVKLAENLVKYFDAVLGVSSNDLSPGLSSSIRERATQNVEEAINSARALGAGEGAAFDGRFSAYGNYLLPEGSLRSPKLPDYGLGILSNSLPLEALDTSAKYLGTIGLRANPYKFLNNALDSAASIMNHYMDYTGRRAMPPIQASQLLGQGLLIPTPRRGL